MVQKLGKATGNCKKSCDAGAEPIKAKRILESSKGIATSIRVSIQRSQEIT